MWCVSSSSFCRLGNKFTGEQEADFDTPWGQTIGNDKVLDEKKNGRAFSNYRMSPKQRQPENNQRKSIADSQEWQSVPEGST